MTETSEITYIDQIDEKIELAKSLVKKLDCDFSNVEGSVKTKKNIAKEIKFLEKVSVREKIYILKDKIKFHFLIAFFQLRQQALKNCDNADVNRKLQCTNLNFFSHLVNSLYNYENITIISTTKRHNNSEQTVKVDFIANGSLTWVKIIARNSDSIKDCVLGRGEYGSKDILEVAEEFIDVASSHLNFFKSPIVVFDFLNQIDSKLEEALEERGIVIGRKFKESNKDFSIQDHVLTEKLNLDITTMLAYISELSNGGINTKFNERLLNEQLENEKISPILPFLEKIFEGKELICCETALNSFEEIISLLAGPKEKSRAEDLKKKMTILPDIENPQDIINIELSSQIKERSRKIFAFGIYHKAITITSNAGFGRSAKMKNYEIPMVTHSARALTEMKQIE